MRLRIPGAAAVHYFCYRLGLDAPNTQLSAAERALLGKLAAGKTSVLEIGVFEGASTRILAESAAPGARIVAVDPFFKGRLGICWSEYIARHHLAQRMAGTQVEIVAKLSRDAFSDEERQSFDLIFIDADHSWDGVDTDWNLAKRLIAPSGQIALHDSLAEGTTYERSQLGSFKYFEQVIERDEEFERVASADTLVVMQRKSEISGTS